MSTEEEDFIKKVGKRIASLRKKKKLRQIDLADLMDIEDSALGRIERGKTNPTLKTLLKLAKALDVELSELLWFNKQEE